jgi:hypothetical protein
MRRAGIQQRAKAAMAIADMFGEHP